MDNFLLYLLLFSFGSIFICVFCIAPIVALKDIRKKIDYIPKDLWDIVSNPFKNYDLLIEVKDDINYAKNKIINANTKIKYYQQIKDYCDNAIKEIFENL